MDDAELECNVELAVRQWLGAMTENVTGDVVRFTRERFRQFFLNRTRQNLLPVASLDDAIDEARLRGSTWSPDDFLYFCWWVKCGSDWPATVHGWQAHLLDAVADDLPIETLSPAAFIVWKDVGYPQEHLLTGRWRELFNRGGYVEDLKAIQRTATEPLVLYRGSSWESRANWSWTSTFSTAEVYRRRHGGPDALTWVAWVPPGNVMARNRRFVQADRLSDEYVVDTMDRNRPGWTIPIRPLDLPARRAHWPQCRRVVLR